MDVSKLELKSPDSERKLALLDQRMAGRGGGIILPSVSSIPNSGHFSSSDNTDSLSRPEDVGAAKENVMNRTNPINSITTSSVLNIDKHIPLQYTSYDGSNDAEPKMQSTTKKIEIIQISQTQTEDFSRSSDENHNNNNNNNFHQNLNIDVRETSNASVASHGTFGDRNNNNSKSNHMKRKLEDGPGNDIVSSSNKQVNFKLTQAPSLNQQQQQGMNNNNRVINLMEDSNPDNNNSKGATAAASATNHHSSVNIPKITAFFNTTHSSANTTSSSSSSSSSALTNSSKNSSTRGNNSSGNNAVTSSSTLIATASTSNTNQYNNNNQQQPQMSPDIRKQLEAIKVAKDLAESKLSRSEHELRDNIEKKQVLESRNTKLCSTLLEVNRNMAMQEGRRRRDRIALDNVRLGKLTPKRVGPTNFQEVWEEGYALNELNMRVKNIQIKKDELEIRNKELQKLKRKARRGGDSGINNNPNNNEMDKMDTGEMDLDFYAESEAIRIHLEHLKKEENALTEERRLLESEKAAHQKELKRCYNEDQSRFQKDLPFLHNRYLLLSLLGKGGFSEVWKALDMVDLREVAVKIHQLNTMWNEQRKQSFIKHVTREYRIHRDMNHPRVVQFLDVFEIDVDCFATVMEYCRGTDLDEKLKREKIVPEKEARFILLQMISGLRYLNNPNPPGTTTVYSSSSSDNNNNINNNNNNTTNNNNASGNNIGLPHSPGGVSASVGVSDTGAVGVSDNNDEYEERGGGVNNNNNGGNGGNMSARDTSVKKKSAIIHFDLKPGNILFDEYGDVKITDFGLSKIIDNENELDGNNTSMELTSQGAGTYWYLPPECFSTGTGSDAPRISTKVDIWSLGVIYYQMLFGKKPFGEGKSQDKVLAEGTILNAYQVDFPSASSNGPKVSEEAKAFIKECLTYDQKYRPDVYQLSQHAYVKGVKEKGSGGESSRGNNNSERNSSGGSSSSGRYAY